MTTPPETAARARSDEGAENLSLSADEVAEKEARTELRASARGWHSAQLAVLGFIGLCGVLQSSQSGTPQWLEILAGVLVLLALVLACLAIGVVGTIAWPVGERASREDLARARGRLRTGIAMTFVAVAVLALAAISSWWPRSGSGGSGGTEVRVVTGNAVVCGELRESQPGVLALDVDGRQVLLALQEVSRVEPVESCG